MHIHRQVMVGGLTQIPSHTSRSEMLHLRVPGDVHLCACVLPAGEVSQEGSDGLFAEIKAFKNAVIFGFWGGVDRKDKQGVLEGTGDKQCHVRLRSLDDVDGELKSDFVRQALVLNRVKGDPTKNK